MVWRKLPSEKGSENTYYSLAPKGGDGLISLDPPFAPGNLSAIYIVGGDSKRIEGLWKPCMHFHVQK